MGPLHTSNSNSATKARSVQKTHKRRGKPRPGVRTTATRVAQRRKRASPIPVPAAIELAIQQERGSLMTSITLLFSLHCILRGQLERPGEVNEAVESAAKWVNVTELTTLLLGKLHTVLRNLDAIALGRTPDVNPEDVEMTEAARTISDEQGGAP